MTYDLILQSLGKYISLTQEEAEYFTSLLELKKVKRKEFLLREGDLPTHNYFMVKGCMRYYQIDREGFEHIGYFAVEGWWITDLPGFLTKSPSTAFVDALEDCEMLGLSKNNLDGLYLNIPKFERYFRILYERALLARAKRFMEDISLTAEQRYLIFRKERPDLEQRIPQKLIASHLGITPEFLSMLRNKIAKK